MLRKSGALVFIIVLALSIQAHAETFRVTNADPSGQGSLSWAVNTVNALNTQGHIISFDANIRNITLTQELTINNSVTINGGGATLEGSGNSRLFTITNGNTDFNSLTFTKGYAKSDNGGAVKIEGSNASATFTNCTFFNNQADNFGGAVCITNGAFNPRTTLTHCTLAGNLAANGGGFALINGRAEILASIITGNTVSCDVYSEGDAVISDYNVIGTANINMGTTTLTGQNAADVFFTNSGTFVLENVDGVNVLRLSGTSPARDIMTAPYGVDTDETGAPRPMLGGYDAGAFEARPVPVESITIFGVPYIQVNETEKLSATITPADASLNINEYPPYGIKWQSNNPNVISVNNSGDVHAIETGSALITAAVYGWNANGQPAQPVTSGALRLYSGTEPRAPMKAVVYVNDLVSMGTSTYAYITPSVSIDINGYDLGSIKGGTNYRLSASSSRLDIVTCEIVSGDTVRLLAGNVTGSCDVTITATPIPDGTSGQGTFTVSVTPGGPDNNGNGDGELGRSSGGGGCSMSLIGIAGALVLAEFIRKERK